MTMAAPAASTTATTSASRIEPPGWAKAVTPAVEADLDGVGERVEGVGGAGRAPRAPRRRRAPAPCRPPRGPRPRGDVWPEPIPMSRPSRTRTIAFEVTPRTRRQARSRSRQLRVGRGASAWPPSRSDGSSGAVSGAVTRTAPPAVRIEPSGSGAGRGSSRRQHRVDDEPQVRLRRRGSRGRRHRTPGATTTSRKIDDERLGDRAIDRPGQGHDATEGGDRDRRPGPPSQASSERRPLGRPARVGVLDDDARPGRAAPGRAPPPPTASRTLLYDSALPWRGGSPVANGPSASVRARAPVAGGRLVRVLAVAQRLDLLEGDGQAGRVRVGRAGQPGLVGEGHAGGRHPLRQHLGDPGVVGGGVAEGLDRQRRTQPGRRRRPRPVDRRQDRVVARRRRDDRHVGVVLGRGADHRRPADVDLLDELVERDRPGRSAAAANG